jgi:PAS domain S-box-containing protein
VLAKAGVLRPPCADRMLSGSHKDVERREARLRALLAATEVVVWALASDGQVFEPYPTWEAYTGQPWDAYRGLGWLQAIHPDDRGKVLSAWSAATGHAALFWACYRLWHEPSGEYRHVLARGAPLRDADGRITEWVGTVADIHARPLAFPDLYRVNAALEAQLDDLSLELRRFFSLSIDVMLSLDSQGRLVTMSPSFERLIGMSAADATGRHFSEFGSRDEAEVTRIEREIRAVLAGRHSVDFETKVMHVDGGVRIVSWTAAAAPEEQRVYGVGRDVTDQKQAELRLIRAERLEAIGRVTGGIAHDFNNVLSAVAGHLEVGARLAQDEKLKRVLQSALQATQRGSKLVGQLLSFARKQELKLAAVDANAMLGELKPMIEQSVRGTVAIELDLDPTFFDVEADQTQLEMVILNLCINARDAMPEGGTIVLRTRRHTVTSATRIDDLREGEYGCISVVDSGVGMDEKTLAHCFEPFFTTKAPGHGTGLGLAQTLGVVQHCGGAVCVESRPGAGTRVDLLLRRAATSEQQIGAYVAPPTLARPVVLVVDDDTDGLESTAALVGVLGDEPLRAGSGQAAVATLLSGAPIEVVLTDYNMPGMNGGELLEEVAQLRPKLVGVLMTGEMDVRAIGDALQNTPVLRKPLNLEQLTEVLEASVEQHRRETGEWGESRLGRSARDCGERK